MYLAKYICLENTAIMFDLENKSWVSAPPNKTECELFKLLPGTTVSYVTGGFYNNCRK